MEKFESLEQTGLLKAVSYFSDLDNTALQRVAQSAIRRAYDAGQVVPIEGRTLYRVVRCRKRLAEIVLVEKEIG